MDWQVIVKNMASTDSVARDKIIMTLGPRITKEEKSSRRNSEASTSQEITQGEQLIP